MCTGFRLQSRNRVCFCRPPDSKSIDSGSLRSYHLLALIFGLFSGVLGLFLSYFNAVAAGPTIVLVAAALFFGTFLLRDKNRG